MEPQITVRLLVDSGEFPLMVQAFEGNKAETTTMLPTIEAFKAAHRLSDITIVADAGMVSAGNQSAIEAAGLTYILGAKIPHVPYQVDQWRKTHAGQDIPDGHVFTQPWPANAKEKAAGQHDRTIFYQYRADRARRTLRGIDEQIGNAEQAVAGKSAVKRNRFVTLTGGDRAVNRDLEAKARALAGIKGYVTNLPNPTADTVNGQCREHDGQVCLDGLALPVVNRPGLQVVLGHPERLLDVPELVVRGDCPAGSRTTPAGASNVSSGPPAATAPSRSRPANRPSPPPTRYPPTSTRPSPRSARQEVRTNLSQVRSYPVVDHRSG